MKTRTQKIVLGLFVFTFGTLAMGKFFDTRCETSCIGEAIAANADSKDGVLNLKKYNIHLNFKDNNVAFNKKEGSDDDNSITINLGGEDADMGGDKDNPARQKEPLTEVYEGKNLKDIKIISYITDWTIRDASDDKLSFVFKGYLPAKEWTVKEKADEISIETKKKGPLSAEILIPKNFTGKIQFVSVSGDLKVDGLSKAKEFELTNVSGDVDLNAAPGEKLTINTVSGDINLNPKLLSKDLQISFHSVSGDMESELISPIKSFIGETVSGDIDFTVGKKVGFNFEMEGVSASYDGLPMDTSKVDSIAHRGARGTFGVEPKGDLKFNSVSGDFHLKQAE